VTQPTSTPPVGAAPTSYRHPKRETYIRCVRCDRPICPDCMRPASVGFQCPDEASAPKVRTLPDATTLPGLMRLAPVTMTLIAINVVVFLLLVATGASFTGSGESLTHFRFEQYDLNAFYNGHTMVKGIAGGAYWRIFTAMFVHYGIVHIGLNMLSLYFIGVGLERRIGSLRFAAIYFVAGIGGGVATYLLSGVNVNSAGASGAIFGLLGAYAVVARRARTGELGSIGGLIVFNLVFSFAVPGISITDHIGGLVTGGVLAAILYGGKQLPGRSRTALAEVAGFVVVLGVLAAITVARTDNLRSQYGPQLGPVNLVVSAGAPTGHPAGHPALFAAVPAVLPPPRG
jgi:membrane associated rhomboid family serine protease